MHVKAEVLISWSVCCVLYDLPLCQIVQKRKFAKSIAVRIFEMRRKIWTIGLRFQVPLPNH